MIQWSRTSLLQQKVLKCSGCLADFLFTWINHVVHENPKCFAKSYYAFLPSKFQFSSWKNFLSSLLSRSMPIVKELEIDFSFFGSVESLANLSHSSLLCQPCPFELVNSAKLTLTAGLEWTIIQLFSIQFYSRMMTAATYLQEDTSSKHFSSKMDNSTFQPSVQTVC